jgi:transposase
VARQLINTPKIKVTVFWNPNGLYVNRFLERSTSVNSAYFAEYVVRDIEFVPALQTTRQQKKKFIPHMSNSPGHKSRMIIEEIESLHLTLAPHPTYSPDLAPSDFFLFGYLKQKMIGIDFESPQGLIDWIQLIFEAIPRDVLENVFESWLRRVQDCMNTKWSYIKA